MFKINMKIFIALAGLFLFLPILFALPEKAMAQNNTRKIIIYKDKVFSQKEYKESVLKEAKAKKIKDLDNINAQVAEVPAAQVKALSSNPNIKMVEDDYEVNALGESWMAKLLRLKQPTGQTIPWGIKKINADQTWNSVPADQVKVGVIDTGIDLTHPDLASNIKGSVNILNPRRSANDDNGHGSHVAGIIAALNNSTGVVGVGPKLDLFAIKVLGASGSGYLSDVISGIDWAITRGLNVINLSLGSSQASQAFHDEVIKAKNAGVTVVAAAGNESGGKVSYPAAFPEAIAVSATTSLDSIASFSSVGPEVDVAAPGQSINSTYKNGGYSILSGTSMAAPHVAGVAALIYSIPVGSHDTNSNGKWDPAEIQAQIERTATDFGTPGKDNYFGAGLVNALKAVTP